MNEHGEVASGLAAALQESSQLVGHVHPGLQALESSDRGRIVESLRQSFQDSLYLDEALAKSHAEAPRWDYLLGVRTSAWLVGVEVHPASPKEVSTVIRKKQWSEEHVRAHLRPGRGVTQWLWVASGSTPINHMTRERRQLSSQGIKLVGGTLCREDIDSLTTKKK